jgi:D-beta-D-heptose 7-phosphate kinase/D-beta-D-heptose 1-phosphate adenosyltransferase
MEFTTNFSNVKVLVIGDVMLDRYWWGKVSRISPEAPVPIVNLDSVSVTLGGAANVAANVVGLGANAFLVGVIGTDEDADSLIANLENKNVSSEFLFKSSVRRTTVKTRILAHNQQIVRVDSESNKTLSFHEEKEVWERIINLIDVVDIVVASDYAKGVISENLTTRLITACQDKEKLILIDPKGKSYAKYYGATMLTPNRSEIAEACHIEESNQLAITKTGDRLLSELSLNSLLVTQGEEGMTLFEEGKREKHLSAEARNVYDVTGAGDTVIACLAVAIGGGATFLEAAELANRAAGLVVEHVGTTAISLEMLDQRQ